MKNVMFILMLVGGFVISELQAQTCQPCPPGCCILSCSKAPNGSAASVQFIPATLDIMAACTPEAMAACQDGKKVSKKEMKACQAACTISSTPTCQPAAAKASHSSEAAIDEKFHQTPKPQKS